MFTPEIPIFNFKYHDQMNMVNTLYIKKRWLILISIFLFFVFTNPSYSNFREFTGLFGDDIIFLHKKENFLMFSIYENTFDSQDQIYLGILMNFINITPHQSSIIHASNNDELPITTDSAAY